MGIPANMIKKKRIEIGQMDERSKVAQIVVVIHKRPPNSLPNVNDY